MLASRLDDPSSMQHEDTTLAPCTHQGRRSRQIVGKLAREEKLDNIVHELSTHKREGSRGTHGLEGPGLRHLKRSGSEWGKLALYRHGSLDNRSSNWSATRRPATQGH